MYEFEQEIKKFNDVFEKYQNKKIALYGIGRKTATLVGNNHAFHFIGLLDRDPKNIGKVIYGLPVLTLEDAENKADLIIINAPETYWEVIFKRIENCKIPVYFLNGEKAQLHSVSVNTDLEYWKLSENDLEEAIEKHDVISFDVFDTLICRKIIRPADAFELLDKEFHDKKLLRQDMSYLEIRNQVLGTMEDDHFTLAELYGKMVSLGYLSEYAAEEMEQLEFEMEKQLIIPREPLIRLCKELLTIKDVYLITDMYYSAEQIKELLGMVGLDISKEKIWVSCENKASKKEGGLWKQYKDNVVHGKTALHIGDNRQADIWNPQRYGIDTFYVMSAVEMLKNSSVKEIYNMVNDAGQSLLAGNLVSRLFSDPFSLNNTRGVVYFDQPEKWGECVWGILLYVFFLWMQKQCFNNHIEKILFCSRDGYMIKKDYDYWSGLNNDKNLPQGDYLYTSRRLGYVSTIRDEQSFTEWMEFPYNGTFGNYMYMRFSVKLEEEDPLNDENVELPKDSKKILGWMKRYKDEIKTNIRQETANYKRYLKEKITDYKTGVMDIGFYGLIQSKIQELVDIPLKGFYFNNYLADDNIYWTKTSLTPCFQEESDKIATSSTLRKYSQLVESLFTAPYGMVIAVDAKGNKICAGEGTNQKNFQIREQINLGIQKYLREMNSFERHIEDGIEELCIWTDKIFGILLRECDLSDEIKAGFTFEENIVKNIEQPIF